MSYSRTIIEGRLTRDPEMKATRDGKTVCTFGVAVNRPGKDAGADYYECVAYDKAAETHAKYLKKGSRVLCDGRMQSRQYESRNGGKMTTWGLRLDSVDYLTPREESGNRGYISTGQKVSTGSWDDMTQTEDDDLPF